MSLFPEELFKSLLQLSGIPLERSNAYYTSDNFSPNGEIFTGTFLYIITYTINGTLMKNINFIGKIGIMSNDFLQLYPCYRLNDKGRVNSAIDNIIRNDILKKLISDKIIRSDDNITTNDISITYNSPFNNITNLCKDK